MALALLASATAVLPMASPADATHSPGYGFCRNGSVVRDVWARETADIICHLRGGRYNHFAYWVKSPG